MVTIRRDGNSLRCIVWGNADPALLAARDRVAWACAVAGGGVIVTTAGDLTPDEFANLSNIPPA
jgi:hypothetical protein